MKKKTALITGASGGIGLELASLFATAGHDLLLVARNAERLKEISAHLQKEHGVTAHILPLDLAQPDAPNELFQHCERSSISVDFLINNAGFGVHGKFSEIPLQEQLDLVQLNVTALTHLCRLFLPGMLQRKYGGIMNVASTAAFQPGPRMAAYYASKSYVLFLSEALATEVKGTGVWVTAFCPGPTATGFQGRAGMEKTILMTKAGMMMDAASAARSGFAGFMKKRAIVIPGVMNRAVAQSVRFSPRSLVRQVVNFLHEGE